MIMQKYLSEFTFADACDEAAFIEYQHLEAGEDYPVSGDELAVTLAQHERSRRGLAAQRSAASNRHVTKKYTIAGYAADGCPWMVEADSLAGIVAWLETLESDRFDAVQQLQLEAALSLLKRNRFFPARRELLGLGFVLDVSTTIDVHGPLPAALAPASDEVPGAQA